MSVKKLSLAVSYLHTSLCALFFYFLMSLRCPHLNNGSYHSLSTYYESDTELINSGRFNDLSTVMWQSQDGARVWPFNIRLHWLLLSELSPLCGKNQPLLSYHSLKGIRLKTACLPPPPTGTAVPLLQLISFR